MITIKTKEEIEILKEGGKKLAKVIKEVSRFAKPGTKTIEFNKMAEKLISLADGEPSFKNYQTKNDKIPFPASICVSINNEIVHGIPSEDRILKEGDIVGFDLGMKYKGLYTDIALTVPIGRVDRRTKKLLKVSGNALYRAIRKAKEGNRIGDISYAIQSYAEFERFNVVRKLVGHGVGYDVHESPDIPNWGRPGEGEILKKGMVFAIEPMIVEGDFNIILADDKWTWKTKDGLRASHFEHTIVVGEKKGEILTI